MPQKYTIPLLHDHHTHPLFYAAFTSAVNLQETATLAEATGLLVAHGEQSEAPLILGHGWRSNRFDWPQDEFEKLPPAAVFNVSLHSLMINEGGAKVLTSKYGDIMGKLSDRDWYEANLRSVLNWFANLNANVESLTAFYDHLLGLGVASAEELLLVNEYEIELFEKAGLQERTQFWAAPDTFAELSLDAKDHIAGLKLFTDGALGARTAALKRPYLQRPDYRGMLIYSDDGLRAEIETCLKTGKSLAIHAIGDRAIEQTLTTLKQTESLVGTVPCVRVEHAQLIDQDMARLAKELGVHLSMQPNFSSDSEAYSDRMDREYCAANNPFRMLIDEVGFECGTDLIFGSDGMPHGIQSAIQNALFAPSQQQRLSIDELVAGYCGASDSRGHIEIEIDEDNFQYDVVLGSTKDD